VQATRRLPKVKFTRTLVKGEGGSKAHQDHRQQLPAANKQETGEIP
jgi:hypothetical protein